MTLAKLVEEKRLLSAGGVKRAPLRAEVHVAMVVLALGLDCMKASLNVRRHEVLT